MSQCSVYVRESVSSYERGGGCEEKATVGHVRSLSSCMSDAVKGQKVLRSVGIVLCVETTL